MGAYLYDGLIKKKKKFPFITDVRGKGLLLGIEMTIPADGIVREFLSEGVIVAASKGNVFRVLPR